MSESAHRRNEPVAKLRLHSSGAASRLAALLVAHIYTDMLVPRALPAVIGAPPLPRCHAGFHHGLLGECLPRTEATVLKVSREYLDAVTGQRLAHREEFVEALKPRLLGGAGAAAGERGGAPTWSGC